MTNATLQMTRNTFFARNFFFLYSLIFLAMVLIAFSDNLFFDVHQKSNSQPIFIIHGVLMLAWYVIIALQTNSIRQLNIQQHTKAGIIGFSIACVAFLSIYYIHWVQGKSVFEISGYPTVNRIFALIAGLCLVLLYKFRKKTVVHRYLLVAVLMFSILPIMDRAFFNLNDLPKDYFVHTTAVLWMLPMIYDYHTRKKVHPILYLGLPLQFILFAAVIVLKGGF